MRTRNQFATTLIVLSALLVMAPNGARAADTPPAAADAPEPAHKPADVPVKPPPPIAEKHQQKGKTSAARKAAEARMARCRLHPEICRQ